MTYNFDNAVTYIFTKYIESNGNVLTWPSTKKKWTTNPKKGWTEEAMDYFDKMVQMENEDRKKYDKETGKENDDVFKKIDEYKFDESNDVEDECIVDIDDVIDI